ncbi:MAG: DUF3037 domain-containing protein [Rhodothermales bacterium]
MSTPSAAPDSLPSPRGDRWFDYDYAIVRVVPHVHLGTFVNVGVVLHARTARYLGLRFVSDLDRLALHGALDTALLRQHFEAYEHVSRGGAEAGPIGLLPPSERFHWLTAPRSAVLQTSEVRTGRTQAPEATLHRLFAAHVQEK